MTRARAKKDDGPKGVFLLIALLTWGASLNGLAVAQGLQQSTPLKLTQTIELPSVSGRIDHLAIDMKGNRLFVAALGNHTVEVVDLAAGKVVHTITGLKEPQGILYAPDSDLLFVADGQLNLCRIYKGATYDLVRTEPDLKDADNIKIEQRSTRTYGVPLVHVGYGSGAAAGLRVLDSGDGRPAYEIPLDGHPESFVASRSMPRIFINVPTAGYIAVADSGRRRVLDRWPVEGFRDFFPMAMDEANARIFVGSRTPPALLVFDAKSGKMVAHVNGVGDTDDLSYDPARKRIYMTGGAGSIGVFEQRSADDYVLLSKLPSAPQARMSRL